MANRLAFVADTIYRITVEAVRLWLVEHVLSEGSLPDKKITYVYPRGPVSMDWGSEHLRNKRIRVTFELEEYDPP